MIACPICDSSQSWPLRWASDPVIQQWRVDHGDVRDYRWQLCRQCGNGYPSFQPSADLLSFFWNRDRQDAIATDLPKNDVWNVRRVAARRNAARTFNLFTPLHGGAPGRFLDVACGLGETVKFFSDRGWDAKGIDVDPALKRFHDEIGIESEIAHIENATIDGKYDIIHISHAIYFITYPSEFLKRLRASLQPDGLLCIVLANFLAPEDPGLPGYAHSFLPTAGPMRYALALAGYRTISCRRKGGSIYIAACVEDVPVPRVYPRLVRLRFQTKALRYAVIGRPKLLLHRIAKNILTASGLR